MRRRKRRRTDETTLTLDALRAAVAWPALAAKPLDYAAALRRVPRGRVATCRDIAALAGGHGTMGETIACARAVRGQPLAHRVVKAGAAVGGAAARALAAEGADPAAPARVSLDACRAERVVEPGGGGPTLVYVHGRGGLPSTYAGRRADWWARGRLAALGRVVLPGAPAHAEDRTAWLDYEADGWTPTAASLEAASARVAAVIRREAGDGRTVYVAAYSEGVAVALDAALRSPARVAGFVGVNGTAPPPVASRGGGAFPVVLLSGTDDATMPRSRVAADAAALGPRVALVSVGGAAHGLGDEEGRLLDFGLRRVWADA